MHAEKQYGDHFLKLYPWFAVAVFVIVVAHGR